jgi:hypothetical protein
MEVSCQLHTLAERAPSTHLLGGWVDTKAGMDSVDKKISCLCQESNPRSAALVLVVILTELSRQWISCTLIVLHAE